MPNSFETTFKVPANVLDVAELALLRVQELFPSANLLLNEGTYFFETTDAETAVSIKQELANALYRQKIYQDTRKIREALVQG